jgi:hypothetical protein
VENSKYQQEASTDIVSLKKKEARKKDQESQAGHFDNVVRDILGTTHFHALIRSEQVPKDGKDEQGCQQKRKIDPQWINRRERTRMANPHSNPIGEQKS